MDDSPLGKLSLELGNQIYERALYVPDGTRMRIAPEGAQVCAGDAWEIAAHQDQGLLDRQGPFLPLRNLDIDITIRTVASIDDEKMDNILVRYLFPCGSDKAATQNSLQGSLESTKGHAMSSGLPEWFNNVFVGLHEIISGAVLDPGRWWGDSEKMIRKALI
ncbi:hypothetical protein LTR17_008016 [Elasticomyces elasticus]|nr:hypothetical protein LTR17_008016 [Elasticomyces elasticus]